MMKLLKFFTASVLFLVASTSMASTILTATDGDVNFVFTLSGAGELYMFDDQDTSFAGPSLFVPVTPFSGTIVGIAGPVNQQNDYIATNAVTPDPGTLLLTDGPSFILGLLDGGTFYADMGVTLLGGNSLVMDFANEAVLTVDVTAIPIPAAVWLFGSGLLGLVVVARRRLSS